jgi:hypothetical protein
MKTYANFIVAGEKEKLAINIFCAKLNILIQKYLAQQHKRNTLKVFPQQNFSENASQCYTLLHVFPISSNGTSI